MTLPEIAKNRGVTKCLKCSAIMEFDSRAANEFDGQWYDVSIYRCVPCAVQLQLQNHLYTDGSIVPNYIPQENV